MKKNVFKWMAGLIALVLMSVLVAQLIKVPTFMLPSIYLVGMIIIALIVSSVIISGIVKLILKRTSFFTALCLVVSISCIFFIVRLYSPTLTIIVPRGYIGQVSLILSNVNKNILIVDSNGIGYINKRTFDKTYTKPIVLETNGTNISDQCVGFNPSTFWDQGSSLIASTNKNTDNEKIQFLSFEIVPKDKRGQKQYYSTDLPEVVDRTKLYKKK